MRMEPSADGLALNLLGGVAFRGLPAEAADMLLAQSKVVALLAYLALARAETFQRRDRLAALLWPDLDQAHARNALRKAVHVARSVLGSAAIQGRGDEELTLPEDVLTCDARELQRAVTEGHFGRAVELYRGELMPGFHLTGCHDFDEWLEARRTNLREDVAAACLALARHLESEEQATEAGRFARKAARIDWSNERVLRRALQMLARLGDRAGALRLYDEFARRLRREMDAEPSEETVNLVRSLRAGDTSR